MFIVNLITTVSSYCKNVVYVYNFRRLTISDNSFKEIEISQLLSTVFFLLNCLLRMYVRLYLYFARRGVWTTFVVVVSVKLLLFLLRFGTKATMSYLVDCNCLVSHAETMFLRWPMKLARILRFTKYKKRRQAILCDFQCAGNSWFFSLSICNGGETEVVRNVLLASGVS